VPPADKKGHRPPRDPASEHRAKITHEISTLSRQMKAAGHPAPQGDPTSGVMLVVEQPVGPRVLQALDRSLQTVGLQNAYVTYAATGLLSQEILAAEPHALVAVGPGAASDIDALEHPLARTSFSTAQNGAWFTWTKGTAGLNLPALAPALEDDATKRRFWKAFLAMRDISPTNPSYPF
jgi:hypothetical protein